MSGKSSKVKMEGIMELNEVISYLEDVVSNMKSGAICMTAGEDCVTLRPANIVDVEMKASQKKDKEKFSLEMSWRSPLRPEEPTVTISGKPETDLP